MRAWVLLPKAHIELVLMQYMNRTGMGEVFIRRHQNYIMELMVAQGAIAITDKFTTAFS